MLKNLIVGALTRLQVVRGDVNRNDRAGAFHRAWGYVFTNHLVGDYYEFGVYKGDGLTASYEAYTKFLAWLRGQTHSDEPWRRALAEPYLGEHPARFFGMDTFEGIPANAERSRIFDAGTFASGRESVEHRCSLAGLRSPQLVLVPGLFAETQDQVRTSANGRPAAIVNIDSDLYQSAIDALDAVMPVLQQGTVLMFDDYNAFEARREAGERRALAEWTTRTGLVAEPWFSYHFAGQSFLCHRPHAGAASGNA